MNSFDPSILSNLYIPPSDSHKGDNGKLLVIGGSRLFHAASLWALEISSKIVDMVFYASVPENNEIVQQAKSEFRNGIVIPRNKIDEYIGEADCVLIGPGLPRPEGEQVGDDDTEELTNRLLSSFPDKKWVIDGGSLQTVDVELLKGLKQTPILTPHYQEFSLLKLKSQNSNLKATAQNLKPAADSGQARMTDEVEEFAKEYNSIVLLKGEKDVVCSPSECIEISGGNAGMTKGGTGDVLAGLVAALYCKNEAFLSATAGSFFNKKAGESLFDQVGYNFNSSDLVAEIPRVMKSYLVK